MKLYYEFQSRCSWLPEAVANVANRYRNHYDRACDFCCGSGSIGLHLLSQRLVNFVSFVDVVPQYAEYIYDLADQKKIQGLLDFHASDCWDQVPEAKYDLVVGNMPYRNNEICEWEERSENWQDLNWDIHRRFFAGVTPRLNKNAIVVLVENGAFSSVNDFMNMAEDSGLLMVDSYPDQLHDKYYYIILKTQPLVRHTPVEPPC